MMTREIRINIGAEGRMTIEFVGFPGETCFDEAELLAGILKEMGLWAVPITVTPKTAEEIALEVDEAGQEIDEKKRVSHS
ncbi:MAG TPA: hypothetical protein PKJ20_05840 [Bacillota bacterium]|nr:hypothetical protein [Bacillota bacterium]